MFIRLDSSLFFFRGFIILFMFFFSFIYWFPKRFRVKWCSCRLTVSRQVSLVEQELLTLPEHMSSPRFLVGFVFPTFSFLCSVLFIVGCPFVLFSFGHCVVYPFSIDGFWLPLWHLQAFLYVKSTLDSWHFRAWWRS